MSEPTLEYFNQSGFQQSNVFSFLTSELSCVISVQMSEFAKDLLLLAGSSEEQQMWVKRLAKKISKEGYVSSGADKNTPGSVHGRGSFTSLA